MKKQIFRGRRGLIASFVASALASAAAAPNVAWAQTADATLTGKVGPDAEVTARNLATGATRRTKANAEGSYTMPGLPPGTYKVDAGPGTETTVTLTVASTATLDLGAGAPVTAEPMQQVVVSGTRLVQTKTPEVGATVSLQQIQTVPQITRNFLEFADSVPGMSFSVDEKGNTSLRGGAQDLSAVNTYIDGVSQKNFIFGGTSGQNFSQGNPFPQLAIGEYKVITSNYKAEFDQVTSAAVTAETRSGTNLFHGEIFGTYTSDHFRAETPSEEAANLKTPSKDKEFGVAVGGPIIQDQLHFFLTYEGKRFVTPITIDPGVTSVNGVPIANLLPASVLAQFGPSDLPFKEDLFFGKLDWEPTDYDRFELSSKVRREDQISGIGTAEAASASIDTKNNDTRVDARWQHSADRWFNDVVLTYEDAFYSPTPQTFGNGAIYAVHLSNDQTVVNTGAADPRAAQNKGQKGPGVQEDVTLHDLHWMGEHTLKTGAKYRDLDLTSADAEDVNPQFTYDVTTAGTDPLPYRVLFTKPVPGLDPTARSKDKQLGLYFQDDWAANDRLTWNLGVRWDVEWNSSYLDEVTPAAAVKALNSQDPYGAPAGQTYAQSLAKGGININDYISNGHNRSAYLGEIQPRLGFSFDLNADQRHVVFGGAGRSYDRDLYQFLQVEQTKSALPEYTFYFQPTCFGTPCIAWDPRYLNGLANLQALVAPGAGGEQDLMNNHLKPPHSDQFSVGMRNRLGDWLTSATVARILTYDGFDLQLGNRFPNGAFWMNGGQPWGNGIPGFNGSLILGNNGYESKTTQVLLSAEKPYTEESGWGTTLAYTYTDATLNHIHIDDCCAFDEETPAHYPILTSPAAPRHRFVATGSLRGPWETVFGAKLTLASPLPVTDLACFGVTYPTGSGCTPIGAMLPNTFGYRSLDLQVTKNFTVYKEQQAYVRVDLLNAFNWFNYEDTINNWGANGVANPHPVAYNTTGNIVGTTREVRLTAGYRF